MNNKLEEVVKSKCPGEKVLFLTIKKEWLSKIVTGEKPEEYRAISKYWRSRLLECSGAMGGRCSYGWCKNCPSLKIKKYDKVIFINGPYFSLDFPYAIVDVEDIKMGQGNSAWGAPDEDVFIIKIGKNMLVSY